MAWHTFQFFRSFPIRQIALIGTLFLALAAEAKNFDINAEILSALGGQSQAAGYDIHDPILRRNYADALKLWRKKHEPSCFKSLFCSHAPVTISDSEAMRLLFAVTQWQTHYTIRSIVHLVTEAENAMETNLSEKLLYLKPIFSFDEKLYLRLKNYQTFSDQREHPFLETGILIGSGTTKVAQHVVSIEDWTSYVKLTPREDVTTEQRRKARLRFQNELKIYETLQTTLSKHESKDFAIPIAYDKEALEAIQEYFPKDLLTLINQESLSDSQILGILKAISRALLTLHSDTLQLVHSDLKPENIFVRQKGENLELVLSDFEMSYFPKKLIGIPKRDGRFWDHTRPSSGTLFYVAPELLSPWRGKDNSDKIKQAFKIDVYSLGILALVMKQRSLHSAIENECYPLMQSHIVAMSPAERKRQYLLDFLAFATCRSTIIQNWLNAFEPFTEEGFTLKAFIRHALENDPINRWSAQELLELIELHLAKAPSISLKLSS
jgi:serine/threonine protein kinase